MSQLDLLRSPRVRLAALTDADLPLITRWHDDVEFARNYDSRPARPRTEAELREWLQEQQKSSTAFVFAVRLRENDELIGVVEIEGIQWTHRTAWLAIAVGPATHRGRGYGYESLRLALRFAFHELNLYRVQLSVFAYNERAIRLYERLGFQREGVYREFLERDGRRHDMILYGILRHEWQAAEAATGGDHATT
jgi:RimJ/RimL family protein N-acetyltransferase